MALIVVGCVNYKFSPEGESHQTGFVATLLRINPQRPDRPLAIEIKDGSIPENELRLDRSRLGDFAN